MGPAQKGGATLVEVLNGRYPFPLLDGFTADPDGRGGRGLKLVSGAEDYFVGHFPGEHVMPGVLIIGCLALTAAGTVGGGAGIPDVRGIERLRFRRLVRPGDRLDLAVRRLLSVPGELLFHAEARVGGEIVAAGRLVL